MKQFLLILSFLVCFAPGQAVADKDKQTVQVVSAPVVVFNRTITEFRAPFLGVPPDERARRAEELLRRQVTEAKDVSSITPTSRKIPQGYAIMINGIHSFTMVPEDADALQDETMEQAAKRTLDALDKVVKETAEARNMSAMLKSTGIVLAVTMLLVLLLLGIFRLRNWMFLRLAGMLHSQASKLSLGGESLLNREHLLQLVRFVVGGFYWAIVILAVYDWLGFTLIRFPYTRPWGERLTHYLAEMAVKLGTSVVGAIPGILVALVIFIIARFIIKLLSTVFDRIERGGMQLSWLDRDTVSPTRRLVSAAIWLFALVMAYPYLPGAGTEAFKGLSVLVGLMVSLGASSIVGQGASGLILMYTRTIRPGEYVRIASEEGTVMELGLFTTRIRTGLGEELTLPNSLILGNVSRNYSRTVKGDGYILDTTVTIGYDTPWRQVHAMLAEAARRTPGVLSEPTPQVFQRALSDFYPEYRLVCQAIPAEPRPRAEVMSALHANIQDVFNEYGVQIMSPHYLGDPANEKTVPKEGWYAAPAVMESDRR